MYIQNVIGNSFYGNRTGNVYRPQKTKPTGENDIKAKFYEDIDKYLNKEYSKRKYFLKLESCIKGLKNMDIFTEAEKQYLDELIVAIDEAGSIEQLSDDDLKILMEKFRATKR